jgi:hypothetical protein
MSEEFSWTYFFLGRWMLSFYAGIFIIIGIKIENYRRQKKLKQTTKAHNSLGVMPGDTTPMNIIAINIGKCYLIS